MTDFITLKKGDLEIQILTPHSPIYNRTRFNHAGFIPSIQYKGVQFAEPEQRDPSRQTSGGAGLCSQFFFTEAEQQAKEGEAFLRMGIGVMTREKELIHFMRDAAFDPLQILMDVGDDSVLFTTTSPEVNGYAYDEVRLVELSGNSLRISVSLTNRGKKPIPPPSTTTTSFPSAGCPSARLSPGASLLQGRGPHEGRLRPGARWPGRELGQGPGTSLLLRVPRHRAIGSLCLEADQQKVHGQHDGGHRFRAGAHHRLGCGALRLRGGVRAL